MIVDAARAAVRGKTVFSPCQRYRYTLWREWAPHLAPYAMFVGLNPSTADATLDDPTVRRCIGFAKAWGYGALCMTNLFGWRSTDPRELRKAADPVGENDAWLRKCAAEAGIIVAAWGLHGALKGRATEVIGMIRPLQTLGLTKNGSPRHPLYVKGDTLPRIWWGGP